jgi:hypothetical protein
MSVSQWLALAIKTRIPKKSHFVDLEADVGWLWWT